MGCGSDSGSSEQSSPPLEQFNRSGWDRLLAAGGMLPTERREWLRRDLAALQEPGQLLAGVVGRRVRHPDDSGEPAALLIYADVLVAASGPSAGYLRPGPRRVVDAVVGEGRLEEVTAVGVHIVELGPPGEQSIAVEALRSLSWVDLREVPSTVSRGLESHSVSPSVEAFDRSSSAERPAGSDTAHGGESVHDGRDSSGNPLAGWYADSDGRAGLRWWDGIRWTEDTADAPSGRSAPVTLPRDGRLGDPWDGPRPAQANSGRLIRVLVGVGVVVVAATLALILTGAGKKGATRSQGVSAPGTTVAPAALPASNSTSLTTVTLNVSAGETITLNPPTGLHDGEVIDIVATGLTPGVPYGADECKAGGPYDDADCDNNGFQLVTADPLGTVRVDYTALKGPFAAHHITCGIPESCEIDVAPTEGSNYEQGVTANLDFSQP